MPVVVAEVVIVVVVVVVIIIVVVVRIYIICPDKSSRSPLATQELLKKPDESEKEK